MEHVKDAEDNITLTQEISARSGTRCFLEKYSK